MSENKGHEWVRKRDGRVVPFDADRICGAIFLAGEAIGKPDAFLARELTDSVIHFLAAETGGGTPETEQIAELVVKVVRELGQPALAKSFAEGRQSKSGRTVDCKKDATDAIRDRDTVVGPTLGQISEWVTAGRSSPEMNRQVLSKCWEHYSRREVYTRDLVSLHDNGLLHLGGLDAPFQIEASVVDLTPGRGLELDPAFFDATDHISRLIAIDNPEYFLAAGGRTPDEARVWLRSMMARLAALRLHGVVNLNSLSRPASVVDLATGPLFDAHQPAFSAADLQLLRRTILDEAFEAARTGLLICVDWHLNESDFEDAGNEALSSVCQRVTGGAGIAFVFDRPRHTVSLCASLDRKHASVLLTVGLNLVRLLDQCSLPTDKTQFLHKLESLVRLSISAARQKREFLRRNSKYRQVLSRGFSLERARLVVVPDGLSEVVRLVTGRDIFSAGEGSDFARAVLGRMREILTVEGQSCVLETCVVPLTGPPGSQSGDSGGEEFIAARSLLRFAGLIQSAAGAGTFEPRSDGPFTAGATELMGYLRYAWEHTELVRIKL